ncbi:MAG: efflux RND transporter periplasmic adaptor subunit [Alphaproteobacteria bacterium]
MPSTEPASRNPLPHPKATARPRLAGRRLILALLLLAAAAAGGAVWWRARDHVPVRYVTAAVTQGPIQRFVTATGTVNPVLTIIIGSYVSGVIQSLSCDYNTEVKQRQVCAKIDPRPYQTVVDQDKANLAVAKAQLEKDKANLAYAKLNYERNRWLAARDSVSQDAADVAKNAYDQAQAQIGLDQATIEQRQAELAAAQVNLDYTDIVSPVDGTVVSRNVTMGQTVAASFQTPTLFLIATDLTKMEVDTNVSESDIGGIKEGARATFTVDAFPKRAFEGSVVQVRQSPQTVQNVVTFDVVVAVDNRDLALKPGMTASTRIIVDQRSDVARVPNQALRYAPGGLASAGTSEPAVPPGSAASTSIAAGAEARLWVLRDGQPVPLSVMLGLDDDNFTEIVKGDLHPGDQVVVGEERAAQGARSGLPLPRL